MTQAPPKERLDKALVQQGFAPTRSRASQMIADGIVCVGGVPAVKPNQSITAHHTITLSQPDHPWVSRAGLKLAHAIGEFGITVADKMCLDIGASTGGFTQVLAHHNARHVVAVDVGCDQLHATIKSNPNVTDLSPLDARDLTPEHLPEPPQIIVCDASFIGLEKILPPALSMAPVGAELVALIKPQFQLSQSMVGKGGIVKNPAHHQQACNDVQNMLTTQNWQTKKIVPSPITGGDGNVEFLCYGVKLGF